jgi:hypothetical protein
MLSSVADMTRKEKEVLVIDLYKRNKPMKEIAQIVHMSFRDIGAIIFPIRYFDWCFCNCISYGMQSAATVQASGQTVQVVGPRKPTPSLAT